VQQVGVASQALQAQQGSRAQREAQDQVLMGLTVSLTPLAHMSFSILQGSRHKP
jgi:hypothetical protein